MSMANLAQSPARQPFFALRRASRFGVFDTAGYWSYPAFLVDARNELFWLHLVLPVAKARTSTARALFKPKAIVVTLPDSSTIVRYENCRLGRDLEPNTAWEKPLGLLPHRAVAALPRSEWAAREEKLLRASLEAGGQFTRDASLPEAYRREFLILQHPVVLSWLQKLTPAFFAALKIEEMVADARGSERPPLSPRASTTASAQAPQASA